MQRLGELLGGSSYMKKDISFYAVWDNSYYQPMFML